jgi:hypothetical protein
MIVFNPKNKAELTYDEIGYLSLEMTEVTVLYQDFLEWSF